MLGLTRAGSIAAGAIVVVFLVVGVIVAGLPDQSPVTLGIRMGALWGLLAMSIAAVMSPFLAEIRRVLGAPFLRVHHVFAAVGLAAITLHPILVAVRSGSLDVFLPVFPFLERYAPNAGRIALPLIYIAVVAALLRTRFSEWRYFHLIMYLALVLGLLHGVVFSDWFFGSVFLSVLYLGLGVAIVAAFVLKRWRRRERRRSSSTRPPEQAR